MMSQAFYTGVSGIRSASIGMDVLTDNMSNIDTVGYRGYTTEFASLFESALTGAKNFTSIDSTVGIGSRIQVTPMVKDAGSLMLSDLSTDLAINGNGWFGVQGIDETFYTRAGDFTFDQNNDLLTRDGLYVLGTKANNIQGDELTAVVSETLLGDIGAQEKLTFPKFLTYPAEPTQNVDFYGNLGLDDTTRTFGSAVVDAQNNKNSLQLVFTKSEIQTPPGISWDVEAKTTSLDGQTLYDTQNGVVQFDAQGALLSNTLSTIDNNGTTVNINLGEAYSGVVATNGLVSSSSTADGTVGGDLVGYEINKNAEVLATFTNGMQSSVGKIAVFHFQNEQGLNRITGTRYTQSSNSGEALFYKDKNGQNILGTDVMNYRLESSNVLSSTALTELIIMQRSFDANSKSITTADQMMQKALNMHK
jgi:flagellar hook protein FlgE